MKLINNYNYTTIITTKSYPLLRSLIEILGIVCNFRCFIAVFSYSSLFVSLKSVLLNIFVISLYWCENSHKTKFYSFTARNLVLLFVCLQIKWFVYSIMFLYGVIHFTLPKTADHHYRWLLSKSNKLSPFLWSLRIGLSAALSHFFGNSV